jgi:IS5 family transposase
VRRIAGELADIAEAAIGDAAAVFATRNERCALWLGRVQAACSRRSITCTPWWTTPSGWWRRPAAAWPGLCRNRRIGWLACMMLMLARSARDGWANPCSLATKAQIVDNADEVILDHSVEIGNPHDAAQLAPAIERITRRTGCPPRAVTADRGHGLASVENDLHQVGVRSVAIPRQSNPGVARREFEHRRAFRNKIKW